MSTAEQMIEWRKRQAQIRCSIDECTRGATAARGLCPAHYRRWYEGLPVDVVLRVRGKNDGVCSITGCRKPSHSRGWCRTHYARFYRTGEAGTAQPLRRAKGEGSCGETTSGYHIISVNGRRKSAHRVAMEKLLGRALRAKETVHHANGNRSDNRTDGPLVKFRSGNLELWSSAQPAGQRVQDKVEYAAEILRGYAPEVAIEIVREFAPHLLVDGVPMPMSSASFSGRVGTSTPADMSTAESRDAALSADAAAMSTVCEQAVSAAVSQREQEGRKVALS